MRTAGWILAMIVALAIVTGAAVARAQPPADVRARCAREWPTDYRLQAYCVEQQRPDARPLLRAPDVPAEVATAIRRRCAVDWPRDLRLRAYCEYQQLDAWHQLNRDMGVPAPSAERWQVSAFDGSTHRFFALPEPVGSLERCIAAKQQIESRYADVTLRCHQLP
jgi:hypothetical protein